MDCKTVLITAVLVSVVVSTMLYQGTASAQGKEVYTIGVLNLDQAGVSKTEAKVLSDELRFHIARILRSDEYQQSGLDTYEMVERTEMEKILDEYEFQFSGCVSDSCAVELGKMMQLDRMVLGSVGLIGQTYTVSIRMIAVQTAKSIAIANRHHRGEIDDVLSTVIPIVAHDLLFKQDGETHSTEGTNQSPMTIEVPQKQKSNSNNVGRVKKGYKDPAVSCLLSMIIVPGFGQFYNGDNGKGLLFLGSAVAGYGMLIYGVQQVETGDRDIWGNEVTEAQDPGAAVVGACLFLGSWLLSPLEAYLTADRRKQDYLRSKTDSSTHFNVSYSNKKVCVNYRF